MQSKIKITQKEIDDIYEIEEITGDTLDVKAAKQEDTTPEFLTEEEQYQNDNYLKDYSVPEEEEELA